MAMTSYRDRLGRRGDLPRLRGVDAAHASERGRLPGSEAAARAKPAILQSLFVMLYAGLWFLGWVSIQGLGRPEKVVIVIGLLVAPIAVGWTSRVPRSALVLTGGVGLLATYILSFFVNGPTLDGATYVISLTGRVMFCWVTFLLLQHIIVMRRAFHLLILSSMVAAVIASVVLGIYGVGIGRTDPLRLQATLDPFTFSTFASAQLAPIGAILALGAAATSASRSRRMALTAIAIVICAVAYLTYFRREHLLSIPIILISLGLVGDRAVRRRAIALGVLVFAGFVAVVAWDFGRPDSVMRARIDQELAGALVDSRDTRLENLHAAVDALTERPFLGFGAGRHYAAITPYAAYDERFLGGFNAFAWLAVEAGALCALSYIVLLIGCFAVAWRRRDVTGSEPWAVVIRCTPALLAQIVLWGFFGNAWDMPLGWFVLGMILAAAEIANGASPGPTPFGVALRRSVTYRGQVLPSMPARPARR